MRLRRRLTRRTPTAVTAPPKPYVHAHHPHTLRRLDRRTAPVRHDDAAKLTRLQRAGLVITKRVGTMTCALLFAALALVSLPTVLKQAGYYHGPDLGGGTVLVVAWVAQTFLQLVLLSVIMVGQDLQSRSADRRGEQTYADAEAILHEVVGLHRRLDSKELSP